MADIGSPLPFIKDEPEDFQFDNPRFMSGMSSSNQFSHHGQQYGSWQGSMGNDTNDLASMRHNYGSQQNLSAGFINGNSGFADDELADLDEIADLEQNTNHQNGFGAQAHLRHDTFNNDHFSGDTQGSSALPVHQRNQYMSNVYSQTPEGSGPIQSPFIHSFNYDQWSSLQPQHQLVSQHRRSSANHHNGSFDMNSRVRNGLQQERPSSSSRSPMTPKTPALTAVQMGTPDSSAFAGQSIPVNHMNRGHRKTPSAQWDNTFSSGPSYIDSPLSSPQSGPVQPQISDIMNGGKSGQLSTKVEQVAQSAPPSTVEAKRQKRRQSHNAVERRRRDNINDRIQELSRLVPPHRLEDDKLRKHLSNSNPFSPSLSAAGLSPPQATSLLAGGTGRRAAGSITQGLPIDEKDKGPAKGDVLNGAVSWTRDLMWMLERQIRREGQLVEMLGRHGEHLTQQFDIGEDEKRMQSELIDAMQRNGVNNFSYSRTEGSGLWVPKYTDHTGAPLASTPGQLFTHSYSVGGSGGNHLSQEAQMWEYNNMINDDHTTLDFKEEEDFGNMEM